VVVSTLGIVQEEAKEKFKAAHHLAHRRWFPWVERRLVKEVPVIALTESVADYFRRLTDQPIHVIPPGINERFFGLERRPAAEARVLCVAVIEPRKGIADLLEALARVPAEHRTSLELLGGVKSEHYHRQLLNIVERRGLGGRVTFRGQVSQEELENVLSRATLLVLPSYEESFGQSVAEAMAAGVPVIATRIRGLRDLVVDGESGLLVEPGHPEELAGKMAALIGDPDRAAELALGGRQRAECFRWVDIADRIHHLYHELIRGGEVA
jgi:glycosyltransferase involved in cell wall biosynthesis